jgi:hypothetical protein
LKVAADQLRSIVWDGTREISVEQPRLSGDRMTSFRCHALARMESLGKKPPKIQKKHYKTRGLMVGAQGIEPWTSPV